jgi:hypothetical protein
LKDITLLEALQLKFILGNYQPTKLWDSKHENLGIFESHETNIDFNGILTNKSRIYYGEDGDGLLRSPSCVNVMNPKQVHNPKMFLFPL